MSAPHTRAVRAPDAGAPVLSVRGLGKSYAGKPVVTDLSFDLYPGEVLALVGENGAGKSTTKNMLCGLTRPSTGEIRLEGAPVTRVIGTDLGVSAVHQELSLFGSLSVAENICIAGFPGAPSWIDRARAEEVARTQLESLGIALDPRAAVETLGTGQQQIVEIAKALLTADKVLILDEPTTSLTSVERENLFRIVEDLRARGLAIVFISHFMEEIFGVCQSYVVLRDGEQVGSGPLAEVSRRRLEELMVGRTLDGTGIALHEPAGEVALRVEGLSSADVSDISFDLRRGEILGISGLMGAGRTELAEAIFGLRRSDGTIRVAETAVKDPTVGGMKALSVCYVPEDRRTNGMFLNRPVRENLSAAGLARFIRRAVRGLGFRGETQSAQKVVDTLRIALPRIESVADDLSGGNQQKTLLGRWLSTAPDILILDEPTKGVDVGAKFDIHATIVELARSGRSVLVVSSDLPELLGLAHRILVMRKGRIVGEVPREDFDAVRIISLAAGDGRGEGGA